MTKLNRYYPGNPKVVLIVDDKPEVREIISVVLTMYGYQCVEACNGLEAKSMYDTLPIDLVITDIYMPEEDGLSLIEHLKEIDPNAKIIAMSGGGGSEFPECLELAESLGAANSFIKPFNHLHFVNIVDSVIPKPEEQFRNIY